MEIRSEKRLAGEKARAKTSDERRGIAKPAAAAGCETDRRAGQQAPRVRLKPNVQKIVAAITYVIAFAAARGTFASQHDILKAIFLADKAHLNKFGRPITFDNYYAMRAGPVPSLTYDFLKEKASALAHAHLQNLPWTRTDGGSGRFYYSNADPLRIDDFLSESDKAALADAFTAIKSLTFGQIIMLTHDDPAYKEAWQGGESEKKAFPMSLGMLFDTPDFDEAEALQFQSKHS
jgi:hypothetical protein